MSPSCRDGVYRPVNRNRFRQFLKDGFEGDRATLKIRRIHLSTVFPEVRLSGPSSSSRGCLARCRGEWRGRALVGCWTIQRARAAAWRWWPTARSPIGNIATGSCEEAGLAGRFAGRSLRDLA